jgi:hypothetical protein
VLQVVEAGHPAGEFGRGHHITQAWTQPA